ncbi:kinesin-like protein, partial [Kipferlia bialata]|eukprot:g4306.t1
MAPEASDRLSRQGSSDRPAGRPRALSMAPTPTNRPPRPSSARRTMRPPTPVSEAEKDRDADGHVSVAVRIRPRLPVDQDGEFCMKADRSQGRERLVVNDDRVFGFDHVLNDQTPQEEVYAKVAKPLLDSFFDGYNATILAYGQTGSGKTYTMGSPSTSTLSETISKVAFSPEVGLIPRILTDIFDRLDVGTSDSHVTIQYLEIYNEDLHDLLDYQTTRSDKDGKDGLCIREKSTPQGRHIFVAGASSHTVTNAAEASNLFLNGGTMRATASTLLNKESSRSHAIFTVIMNR